MRVLRLPALLFCLVALGAADLSAQRTKITIYAETGRGYRREKLPDGEPAPVRYAISFEKPFKLTSDAHIQSPEFAERLTEALVANLEANGFILAENSADADQLLLVRAGTTELPSWATRNPGTIIYPLRLPELEDEQVWATNAQILGYTRSFNHARLLRNTMVGRTLAADLREDLLEPRHYIVILAYKFRENYDLDAKEPWLWRAHVNVEVADRPFIDRVDSMLAAASGYLGNDSARIIRKFRTEVQVGDPEVIETLPAESDEATDAP